jgi:hypothetical protein
MPSESRNLSELINRPADTVYDYASDPVNLPAWAPGLGTSVEQVDGRWLVNTPGGRVGVAFVPRNEHGILDHDVTLPSGEVIYNPVRVTRNGSGSEIAFSLRRLPGMSDEEFDRDARAVSGDLARLKQIMEEQHQPELASTDLVYFAVVASSARSAANCGAKVARCTLRGRGPFHSAG